MCAHLASPEERKVHGAVQSSGISECGKRKKEKKKNSFFERKILKDRCNTRLHRLQISNTQELREIYRRYLATRVRTEFHRIDTFISKKIAHFEISALYENPYKSSVAR
jgi:hypothetical protein